MAPAGSKVQQFILHALIPIACSIVLGFIFFQDGVFNRLHASFQFLSNAVVASLFYYLLVYLRPRDAYLGLLVLFMLTLVTTGSTRPAYILRDILYVAAIGTSVFIYFRHFKKAADTHYAYPAVILAGIYGLIYSLAGVVLLAVDQAFGEGMRGIIIASAIHNTAGYGLWIGFAVGAGIALADIVFSRRAHRRIHAT